MAAKCYYVNVHFMTKLLYSSIQQNDMQKVRMGLIPLEKKKMMHIGIGVGDVGRYVFLPGSPERTEKIARHFENPREIAYHREYRTWVGTLDGVPVAVTSTGIGGPSTAIAVEELYQCGADTMIRVGSCASTSPKVGIGDIVIPSGAIRMEGVGDHYLPTEFPAVPDFQLMKVLEEAALEKGYRYDTGVTITKAGFYSQTAPQTKPIAQELMYRWDAYVKGGATNTSMECAPLFLIAGTLGIRSASVMVSATNCDDYSERGRTVPMSELEERVIEVAIEAMRRIIRKDQKG